MAGKGELELFLQEFVKNNNLNNIIFNGWVDNVANWLKKIDILVVPSKEEGFGLTILEGLAANKIIIASDIKSIKELITNKENGILFQVGDDKDLAEQLKNLLISKSLMEKYYNNVNQWIKQNEELFDIKTTTLKYEEVFNLDN